MKRMLALSLAALAGLLSTGAQAAAPGITGTSTTAGTFSLIAQPAYITQPDGQSVYSWGYGCTANPPTSVFVPVMGNVTPFCTTMQVPGPTLVVTEGQTVTVTLRNNLPTAAGNTSILFPGFTLTSACPAGQQGLLTCEALPGVEATNV